MQLFLARPLVRMVVLGLLLGLVAALAVLATIPPLPVATESSAVAVSDPATVAYAAQVAVRFAQAGTPSLQLQNEPTMVRGRCLPGSPTVCKIVLFGTIINTIPAGAGGSPPERTEILAQWQLFINASTFEVIASNAYPDSGAPDVDLLPTIPYRAP